MKTLRIPAMMLLVCVTALPIYSQEVRYNGPLAGEQGGVGFFPIGWSADGQFFAYGWFQITYMQEDGSQIGVRIQNMVSDNILFEEKKTWIEGTGPDGSYPVRVDEAWKPISSKVNEALLNFDIRETDSPIYPFPLIGEDELNIEIRNFKAEPGSAIYAVSYNRGEKMIFSDASVKNDEIKIVGGTMNPDLTRVAVILRKVNLDYYSEYLVIGCHYTNGFDGKRIPQEGEIRFKGPDINNEEDFLEIFPIGWSENGQRFAYGWFEMTQMISNGSTISIRVQDLVTDEILLRWGKSWDESNRGDVSYYYPTTAKAAWDNISGEINEKLFELNILDRETEFFRFPVYSDNDEIYIEINTREAEDDYNVIYDISAISNDRGVKRISSFEMPKDEEIRCTGGIWNPDQTRIGVIMNSMSMNRPYSEYWIIGCHTTSGFEMIGR